MMIKKKKKGKKKLSTILLAMKLDSLWTKLSEKKRKEKKKNFEAFSSALIIELKGKKNKEK